jgi:exonuclease SbcC
MCRTRSRSKLFSSVYGLFNEYFKEWFSTLMEDESLSVRLDSDFAPVIVQDGYETTIENLSGGEKTSVCVGLSSQLEQSDQRIPDRDQDIGFVDTG